MDARPTRPAGRPRDPGLDLAIRSAALDLLAEGGLEACALDAVARRAGVGKATIYRRWASKDELVVDVLRSAPISTAPLDTDWADTDLVSGARTLLLGLVATLDTPMSRATRQLMPYLATHPELVEVYRAGPAVSWGQAMLDLVARAEARGEIPVGAVPPVVLRAAAAMITQRWLMQLGPVDDALVDELVEGLVRPLVAARS